MVAGKVTRRLKRFCLIIHRISSEHSKFSSGDYRRSSGALHTVRDYCSLADERLLVQSQLT